MCVFGHECRCLLRPEPLANPRIRVTDGCEPPDVAAERWTQIPCKGGVHPLCCRTFSLRPHKYKWYAPSVSLILASILAVNTQWNEQFSASKTGLSTCWHETRRSFNFQTSQFPDYFSLVLLSPVYRSLTTVFTTVTLKDSAVKWVSLFSSLTLIFFFFLQKPGNNREV